MPDEESLKHDELVDSTEQPFLDHIIELRQRILHGLLAVLVLFFPIYFAFYYPMQSIDLPQ